MQTKDRLSFPFSRSSAIIAGFGFFLLYAPIAALVWGSFVPGVLISGSGASGGLTLEWYRRLFADPAILEAFEVSWVVGFWSTLGATFLGTSAALALSWGHFPGKKAFSILTYVPLVLPEIVLGLALLTWFVLLNLTLGLVSVILAHITFSTSYVLMTVKTRLDGFDGALLEAARDLGASPWQSFWRVTFPLILPGITSGALMAFTLSFDDFLITYFTAGSGSDTLPLKIYSMIKFGVTPEINALSTLMVAVTWVAVSLFFGPMRRRGSTLT